jgi:hypothetical protein
MRLNTRSIRFRLTAWYGSILVALGLAFGAYCYWRLDHFLSVYSTELFSHRAERIADTLLANVGQNGDAYVAVEIETRYAPEANDRFIRVTNSDGTFPVNRAIKALIPRRCQGRPKPILECLLG